MMKHPFDVQLRDPTGVIPHDGGNDAAQLAAVREGQPCYADSLGWHRVRQWAGEEWLSRCRTLAEQVRRVADALVVIGIGGSNQAARAVIDALKERSDGPEIIWAGNSISAHSMSDVLRRVKEKKSVYINIIAKNFETLEPGMGFRVLRQYLQSAYGPGWGERVIATGTPGSRLEELAVKHGFHFLPFPRDIGGRFTALSPVGLFPVAVAGLDIEALAQGAADMEQSLKSDAADHNPALLYAQVRSAMYRQGLRIEMLAFFEPRLFRFSKWWKQLFGESEGKDGKGLYPTAANYSEDLHSIGQFVQDGTHCLFESFLEVRQPGSSILLRADQVEDGFDYLNGMDICAVNEAAFQATIEAHSAVFPCIQLSVSTLDEYTFGQLFYFFEFACYLSCLMLGVNPFDQPGVEDYKKRMFQKLGKNV